MSGFWDKQQTNRHKLDVRDSVLVTDSEIWVQTVCACAWMCNKSQIECIFIYICNKVNQSSNMYDSKQSGEHP